MSARKKKRAQECLFCNSTFQEDSCAFVGNWYATPIPEEHEPAARGHVLLIPYRHVELCEDLSINEQLDLFNLLRGTTMMLQREDPQIRGFNFGANLGKAAGQTIAHLHFHLIPRRAGDSDEPIGIRNALRRCLKQQS